MTKTINGSNVTTAWASAAYAARNAWGAEKLPCKPEEPTNPPEARAWSEQAIIFQK
jgi:hypothetical protein